MPRTPPGKVRIIAGDWRGRRLEFAGEPHLRPTPDRVRETLFNWLQPAIGGAVCLDLFAGSGALGFEALSRGAAHATLVDADARVCAQIRREAKRFGAQGIEVVHDSAESFIANFAAPAAAAHGIETAHDNAGHAAANADAARGIDVAHDNADVTNAAAARACDIVFLDPPFASGLLEETCRLLDGCGGLIHPRTLIYAEAAAGSFTPPRHWRRIRRSRAHDVEYFLLTAGAAALE